MPQALAQARAQAAAPLTPSRGAPVLSAVILAPRLPVLSSRLPVTWFTAAVCNGDNVKQIRCRAIYNRERKSPENEMPQVVVGTCAQLGIRQQQLYDAPDFITEALTKPV
jgi:hypothetical protein